MKIALLTDGIFPDSIGGIQKHSHLLIKYFSKNNIFVDVFYCSNSVDAPILNEKDYNLKYLKFFKFKMPTTFYFPGHYVYNSYRLSKLYYNKIKLNSYDAIYAQGFTSWYLLKKEPFKRNVISNLHGLEMYQLANNKIETFKKLILKIPSSTIVKKSRYTVSLGGELKSILLRNGAKSQSVVTIPNAIESSWMVEKLHNKKINKLKFIFVGRYERRKGLEEIFQVIQKLILIYDFEFHFIGKIPEHKQILNNNFFYHGMIKNPDFIKDKLIDSDILVCPSYSEGMPTVILEAMACGCAIIATDVGAVKTMVNEKNGWLIKNDDIVIELEKAIKNYFIKKGTLFDKKLNSLKKVKKDFIWDNVIHDIIDMMKALPKKNQI